MQKLSLTSIEEFAKKKIKEVQKSLIAGRTKRVIGAVMEIDPDFEITLLDVGARGGLKEVNKGFPLLKDIPGFSAVGIEPDPEDCKKLEASGDYKEVFPIAVADVSGERSIYITRNPAVASIFEPNEAINGDTARSSYFDVVATATIECKRIDDILPGRSFDFIKTDVQGATHEVLTGAGEILDNALACDLDLYFDESYKGQQLFCATDTLLKSKGFRMALCRAGNSHGYVGSGGFLYIKDAKLIKTKGEFLKLIIIAAVMGHFDFIEYLLRSHNRDFLKKQEGRSILAGAGIQIKKKITAHRYDESSWKGLEKKEA